MAGDVRRRLLNGLAAAAAVSGAAAVALWRVLRPLLRVVVQLLLALIVIFEEWGWQPLAQALAALARFKPWAMLERWIAGLPPYGALGVFTLPAVLLFPLKLVALWLLAGGHVLLAGLLFVAAKLAGTAFLARIFMLTQPALMRIGWFARAYGRFMPWKEGAEAWLRTSWAWRYGRIVKGKARKAVRSLFEDLRPRLERLRDVWRPRLDAARSLLKAQVHELVDWIRGRTGIR